MPLQLALNLPGPMAARESLFLSTDGQPYTTSRAVAERFGKRHDNVIRDIETLLADLPDPAFSHLNFEAAKYLDAQKKPRTEYRLTHDAFALLAMGFTGRDALAWKVAFLQAFNAMETALHAKTSRYAAALNTLRPILRPIVEATEAGQSRSAIAAPLGKSCNAVTYHRRSARRLGLLAQL